ncbi:MAG: response regulator transcription factor [Saprospiraceae bacterium]|nr:response regulator transcription factor [Saprospiraceae bacterium]
MKVLTSGRYIAHVEMTAVRDIQISVIEDSRDFNRALELMINGSEGLSCHSVFHDAETACREIPANPPDVVLVDLGLPGMNGIECIRQLSAKLPRLQFLVLTIKDQEDEIFGALQAGASGYLLKLSSPFEILRGIRELHDGGAPMSANIARKVVRHFRKPESTSNPYDEILTAREQEILQLLARGRFYKEISSDLAISIETVKSHCHNIYKKLHVASRTEALNKYYNRH